MKRRLNILMLLFITVILCSCSSTLSNSPKIETIKILQEKHEALADQTNTFEPIYVYNDSFDLTLIGCGFGNTFATDLLDSSFSSTLSSFISSTSVSKENRDTRIAIYYSVTTNENIKSKRDIPEMDEIAFPIIDNQGSEAIFIKNSLYGKYIELGEVTYGSLLYWVYLDSEYFDIKIGDEIYRLNTSDLTKR